MENNNFYKLVGIVNIFGVYPDFVYPIFERNGKFYFQKTNNTIIKSFNEIKDDLFLTMIRFLNVNTESITNKKNEYCIGNEAAVAFQLDKENFFISDTSEFVNFISNFDTDDDILREQIDTFLDGVNIKKNLEKKKKKLINNFS